MVGESLESGVALAPGGRYTVHGLSLVSEISLPELGRETTDTRRPDVSISVSRMSKGFPSAEAGAEGYVLAGEVLYLDVPDIARFSIRGGTEIVVEPRPGAAAESVRLFLLGSVLGALLHQVGRLPIHASTLRLDGAGVAFCADSGGGKSTLAGWLDRHGYEVTGDDVCALAAADDGDVLFHPGVPRIRLAPDAMQTLGGEPETGRRESRVDRKIPFVMRSLGDPGAVPLRRIYWLEFTEAENAPVLIEPLGAYESLLALRSSVYRPSLIELLGRESEFFESARRVLESVETFRLTRSRDLSRLDEVVGALEDHLEDLGRPGGGT